MSKNQGKSATETHDLTIDDSEEIVQPKKAEQWKPTYQTSAVFDSHLFKLHTSKMTKNMSYTNENPDLHQVDHQHFFHTVDSSGKQMIHSTPTGGHFHVMTLTTDPETGAPIAKCSGPKAFKQIKGKKLIVDMPTYSVDGNNVTDNHTHNVTYERSSKVQPRTVNFESVRTMDKLDAAKNIKVDGITG